MKTNIIKREGYNAIKSLVISIICLVLYVSLFYIVYGHFPYLNNGLYSSFILLYIGFFVITYTIGKLFEQLLLSFIGRFFSVFTYYFLLSAGIWLTTYETFSTQFHLNQMLFSSFTISIITAFFISIFNRNNRSKGFFIQIKQYVERRTPLNWFMRIIIAVILLFVTYFLLNELIFPFIEPYYDGHPAKFLEGITNGKPYVNRKWMWVQSLLIVIIFFPLFALWRGSKSSLLFWVGFPLFLICALGPFFVNFTWPLGFRFTLLVEMTAIMYTQSFIIVHLFYLPREEEIFGTSSHHKLRLN